MWVENLDGVEAVISGFHCNCVVPFCYIHLYEFICFSLSLYLLKGVETFGHAYLVAHFAMAGDQDQQIPTFFLVLNGKVLNIIFFLIVFLQFPNL